MWPELGFALGLLIAGLMLLWLEVLVVSFGLIGAVATACLVGAVYYGFQVNDAVGWLFAIGTPTLAVVVLVVGVRRVAQSRLVMRGEVGGDAGYRHATDTLGIAVGAQGQMVTAGFPTGRARFDGGEIDVRAHSGTLEQGARVQVLRIEGATVEVVALAPEHASDADSNSNN